MIRLEVPIYEGAEVLEEVKGLAALHPGEHALRIIAGGAILDLGPAWTYDESALPALSEFGKAELLP